AEGDPAAPAAPVEDVERSRGELVRRFGGIGGCMARVSDYARLLPGSSHAAVEEALYQLWDEGVVEMHCLSDGAFVFHFPPR
ncbi:MAG TPA: hypothetical protein VFU47_10090, partial [Armatimonadota bacterium]|nr:hypothetical protein [Armatimonadota bacterium]